MANEVGNKVAMYASSRDSIASALLSMGVSLNTKNKEDILKLNDIFEDLLKDCKYPENRLMLRFTSTIRKFVICFGHNIICFYADKVTLKNPYPTIEYG